MIKVCKLKCNTKTIGHDLCSFLHVHVNYCSILFLFGEKSRAQKKKRECTKLSTPIYLSDLLLPMKMKPKYCDILIHFEKVIQITFNGFVNFLSGSKHLEPFSTPCNHTLMTKLNFCAISPPLAHKVCLNISLFTKR